MRGLGSVLREVPKNVGLHSFTVVCNGKIGLGVHVDAELFLFWYSESKVELHIFLRSDGGFRFYIEILFYIEQCCNRCYAVDITYARYI